MYKLLDTAWLRQTKYLHIGLNLSKIKTQLDGFRQLNRTHPEEFWLHYWAKLDNLVQLDYSTLLNWSASLLSAT